MILPLFTRAYLLMEHSETLNQPFYRQSSDEVCAKTLLTVLQPPTTHFIDLFFFFYLCIFFLFTNSWG